MVLTVGSYATGTYEPCQVRKEAAISKHSRVPQVSLIRANYMGNARKGMLEARCTTEKFSKEQQSLIVVLFLLKDNFVFVRFIKYF